MATLIERCELLERARLDKGLQAELRELCKRDINFWFDYFCYTYNPRLKSPHLPFNLFPFQRQSIECIQHCIDLPDNLIIDKSRDMGITWLVLLVFQHYWQFKEVGNFHLGSKTEDLVDVSGDISTLFPKIRYNADMQPLWLLPRLKKGKHDAHLKLVNPITGSIISGQASTPDFGRSGRYTAVLLDEFARHPYGELAHVSVSQSTDCAIALWTPYGKKNYAFQLAHADDVMLYPIQADEIDELTRKRIIL